MGKIPAEQRRAELREYLDGVGILNLNKSELGRKYGVSDVVIGKDFKLILSDCKPGDVSLILKKFDGAFQLALNRALRCLADAQGSKETNDSIRTLILTIHEYLTSLSRLGYSIGEDGAPPLKPSGDFLREYLTRGDIKDNEPKEGKTPVDYPNLHHTPSQLLKPEDVSSQPKNTILETLDDDLEPVEIEEQEDECQK